MPVSAHRKGALFPVLLLFFFMAPGPGVFAAAADFMTAHQVFLQLPSDIFENTPMPISEREKEVLARQGYIQAWAISHVDRDTLIISALYGDFSEVSVKLFRAGEGGVAVLGARSNNSCAVELWRYDRYGGLVPEPAPPEPVLADFIKNLSCLPPQVLATYRLCLSGDELEAQVSFWDDAGLVEIPVDYQVFYRWDGGKFVKYLQAVPLNAQEERSCPLVPKRAIVQPFE